MTETTTTYRVIFRHPRGYKASTKVRATSEAHARALVAERKPNVTILEVDGGRA